MEIYLLQETSDYSYAEDIDVIGVFTSYDRAQNYLFDLIKEMDYRIEKQDCLGQFTGEVAVWHCSNTFYAYVICKRHLNPRMRSR